MFLLYCKVHVSFITFILKDEHELSLSAQWKPGYHGPGRAHNTLQKISLRTKLSKPGEPREGFPSRGTSPREGTRLSKPGEPRGGFSPRRGISPREGISDATKTFRQGSSQRLGEASNLAVVPSPRSKLCLRDRAHMGSAPSAESRARQSTDRKSVV